MLGTRAEILQAYKQADPQSQTQTPLKSVKSFTVLDFNRAGILLPHLLSSE